MFDNVLVIFMNLYDKCVHFDFFVISFGSELAVLKEQQRIQRKVYGAANRT